MSPKDYNDQEHKKQSKFLKKNIFQGLKNLNDGFDTKTIFYFSESDFEVVLKRIEENKISIYGIEPWLNGKFYDVLVHEDYNTKASDPRWYKKAFSKFKDKQKGLMYAASYAVPLRLLKT